MSSDEPRCALYPEEVAPRYNECYHNPKWCSCDPCRDALKRCQTKPPEPKVELGTTLVEKNTSLPDDAQERLKFPMAAGLLDYFPNALAEVSFLSFMATQQHHPDAGMHWDRSKSLEHRDKIMRHLVDTGKVDDKGLRHSAMVAWRALALLQEELERDLGLPPSRASRNRPLHF